MKILIIEDEEKIANILKKGLIREGFSVDTANDGEQALFYVENGTYDCAVLDLMIPKISGLEVLQMIRNKKNYTPVLILTAKDSIDDKVAGLNIGADDYMAKPYSFAELIARIRALIRRTTTHETILQVDTLKLDPYAHVVKRSDQDIALSAKEFMMLEYLMRHKGAILSEEQILENVWDFNADRYSNVVAAHIKNLRLKIDKNFSDHKQLIRTIRGIGYTLDDK